MEQLFTFLQAGGDLSTMAIVYLAWRFDRRLFNLEVKTGIKSL